jgi:hypothetical protein
VATPEQIDDLLTKMRDERAALVAAASALAEDAAEYRPPDRDGEAGWSAKEQFAHLAEMEVTYRAWVKRALREERPDLASGTQRDPVAYPLERAHEATVSEHLEEMARQRERTLALIEGLTPAEYDRTASQPNFGELTVLQWLRSYYRHDRMHAAQIEGRESDYRPRFTQGEPDQRRRRG